MNMVELKIGWVDDVVVVVMPGPCTWLKFSPEQARLLAAKLQHEANEVDKQQPQMPRERPRLVPSVN